MELNAARIAWAPLAEFPGRILRREEAEARAGGAGQALHPAAVVAIDGVDVNLHRLAGAHPLDLRFAEVRGHPEVARLGEGEELLPGLDPIANVDRLLSQNPRRPRGDPAV